MMSISLNARCSLCVSLIILTHWELEHYIMPKKISLARFKYFKPRQVKDFLLIVDLRRERDLNNHDQLGGERIEDS